MEVMNLGEEGEMGGQQVGLSQASEEEEEEGASRSREEMEEMEEEGEEGRKSGDDKYGMGMLSLIFGEMDGVEEGAGAEKRWKRGEDHHGLAAAPGGSFIPKIPRVQRKICTNLH